MDTLTQSNAEAINSVKGTTQVQPPVIPGYTNDPGAESVLNGITPVENSTNKQTSVTTDLTKQGGTSTVIKNSGQ